MLNGTLAQCNKLKNKKIRLYIIFRKEQGEFEVIQVIVTGKRDKETIYNIAGNRIDRKSVV